jgi:putative polyhydroxyalkanoate system protein
MSQIVVHRPHRLSLGRAKRLAATMAERLRTDLGGSYTWDGDTLRFRRAGASGHVAVTPDDIEICVSTSFLLRPLRARIEREILAFCDEYLGRPAPLPRPQAARPAAARRGSTRSSPSHGASRSGRPK